MERFAVGRYGFIFGLPAVSPSVQATVDEVGGLFETPQCRKRLRAMGAHYDGQGSVDAVAERFCRLVLRGSCAAMGSGVTVRPFMAMF